MALELWVHGPRYGESTLLIWYEAGLNPDEKVCKAALIDCHGTYTPIEKTLNPAPAALLPLLDRQEPLELAFVAGTHPHLDHVACLAQVVAELGKEHVEQTLWWGGHFSDALDFHHKRAAHHEKTRQKDRARASKAAVEFLIKAERLQTREKKPMVSHSGISELYHGHLPKGEGTIRVWGISPCAHERDAFHAAMRQQYPTAARLAPAYSNRTSLGFLIQYKDAQILLGGDMEVANWEHFNNMRTQRNGDAHDLPPLCPHVIKVSHHGSPTGCIPGMWEPGSGFFETAPGKVTKPVCIVTPWKQKLPDENVIEKIRLAGCRVVVTGRGKKPPVNEGSLADKETRKAGSYCHLRIHGDGTVEDIDLFGCMDCPAL